jgi:hypothetical protein
LAVISIYINRVPEQLGHDEQGAGGRRGSLSGGSTSARAARPSARAAHGRRTAGCRETKNCPPVPDVV